MPVIIPLEMSNCKESCSSANNSVKGPGPLNISNNGDIYNSHNDNYMYIKGSISKQQTYVFVRDTMASSGGGGSGLADNKQQEYLEEGGGNYYHRHRRSQYQLFGKGSRSIFNFDLKQRDNLVDAVKKEYCINKMEGVWGNMVLFSGIIITVTCFVLLYRSAYPFDHQFSRPYSSPPLAPPSQRKEVNKLEEVLKKAATKDKTVIFTTLNEPWAAPGSIFDIFLESFRIGNETSGLLNNLVVVTLDDKAYNRCLAVHPHCYVLVTAGTDFSGEAFYMSTSYMDMMWRRLNFMGSILELGYNFIFTDGDIMWFRDPFPRFYLDADFQIACDMFGGNASDINNMPNGGFIYVKSNERTIKFYKFWNASRETYPGLNEQDVLNKIKFESSVQEIGVKMKFLDTAYFGGFCEPSRDLNQVCTMHANCCVGLDKKIHDLKVMLDDWRNFSALQTNASTSNTTTWTVPQDCRHDESI